MINIKKYLWTLPFLSFLIGYYAMSALYRADELQTPALVGKKLPEAFSILSAYKLNPRILAEKEDPDLPEGTILSQTPHAGRAIKQNQSVYCVISKKLPCHKAPYLIGISAEQCIATLKKIGIRTKHHYIESLAPAGICIAQQPNPNELIKKNTVITYISSGNNKPIIFPNLKDKPIETVQTFLQSHNITADISHTSLPRAQHSCEQCVVVDQRPLPGSIITLSAEKPLLVQLQVQPSH